MNLLKRAIKYLVSSPNLIFLIFATWLSLEYIILGPFSYVRLGDNLDSLIPRFIENWNSNNGYWQPLFTGGIDRLANATNSLRITNIMFLFFPGWLAIGIILVGGIYLGQKYLFLLCHRVLRLGIIPSIIASLLYGYSLVLTDILSILAGLCIVPFIIYYIERIFFTSNCWLGKKVFYGFLLGIIFSLFSSLILTLPFALVVTMVWFFLIRRRRILELALPLTCLIIPAILFNVQEAMSLIINSKLSQRGLDADYFHAGIRFYISWVKKLVHQNWLSFLIIVISLVGIKSIKKSFDGHNRRLFYVLMGVIFSLLFIAPLYQPLATNFGEYLGKFRNFDFGRFYLFLPFFVSIFIAFVLDKINYFAFFANRKEYSEVNRAKPYSVRFFITVTVLVALIFSSVTLKYEHGKVWVEDIGSYKANVASPDIEYIKNVTEGVLPFRVGTINSSFTQIKPTLANLNGLESVDGHANVTSKENIDFFKLLSRDDSIKSSMYLVNEKSEEEVIKFNENSAIFLNENLLSLANVRFLFSSTPINLSNFTLVQSPSSDNFYDWGQMNAKSKLKLKLEENFTGRKLLVYENENVFPRFFLTKQVRLFSSDDEMLQGLVNADYHTLRKVAFLSNEEVDVDYAKNDMQDLDEVLEKIEIKKYTQDEIELLVESDGPSMLIISNVYSPFWKIYINGKQERVLHAYHAYMGVLLKSQNNDVVLRYEPPYKF